MKKQKVYYYTDPLNDEFSGIKKKTITVDKKFKYIHKNPFWNALSFIIYRLIILPFAFLYCKIKFGYKIIGKEKLKKCKGKGYFIFSNHTLMAGDAFFPSIVNFPKKPYIIVHPDNLSTKGTKNLICMLGALPIPNKFDGMSNFKNAIEHYYRKNHPIIIYPEAHIWPYYTGIRPFKSTSFKFPAEVGAPVYCTTTTFQKREKRKTPKVVIYVDGPFYCDQNLSVKENQVKLRDEVYSVMLEKSKNSNCEVIKYEKRED